MKKVIFYILHCFMFLLFCDKAFPQSRNQFNGYWVDINKSENYLLYQKYDNYPSEFLTGSLILYDLLNKKEIVLVSKSNIEYSLHARFINDSLVIIPTSEKIWIYDFKNKKSKQLIYVQKNKEYVFAFDFDINSMGLAYITVNQINNVYKISYSNLKTKTSYSYKQSLQNKNEIYYRFNLFIIDNQIIYKENNNLHYLVISKNDTIISNKLLFFSLSSSGISFLNEYNNISKLHYFNFCKKTITTLKTNINTNSVLSSQSLLNHYKQNNNLWAQISIDNKYYLIDSTLVEQKEFLYYNSFNFKILNKTNDLFNGFIVIKNK